MYLNRQVNLTQLTQTKFYQPQADAHLLQRPHLLTRLDVGLSRQLILVSAPAGFGKTTLVSQWLAGLSQLTTWLSLDEAENQLPQFLRYVCAAVRRAVPEACNTLQALLNSANLPDLEHLTDLLIDELNALPSDLILVLDDYHHIRTSEIHHLIRQLLRYRPPRLHLVILTRTDPPLYLGRLRLSQQITEIRAVDLRFSLPETRHFLQKRSARPLNDKFVRSFHTKTEGWIIGLQLIGISLQSQLPDQLLASFGGNYRLLTIYLVDEVISDLPPALIKFLTRTALVNRFCAPLGDALLTDSSWPDSSQEIIARLERQNVFIIALDSTGDWFRYHDLFRDFLLHRLKKEEGQAGLLDLHRRAGAWLAQAGLIDEALHHLLAAGEDIRAADLVETNLHPLLNQQIPAPVLARWLDLFPEQTIQTHPGLLTAQSFLFVFRWDMAAIGSALDQARTVAQADNRVSDERRRRRLAVLDLMWGFLLYWQGETEQAIHLLQRCLDHLEGQAGYSFTTAQATQFLALAIASRGQQQTALTLLQKALAEATSHHRPMLMILLGARTAIQLYAGDLAGATATADRMLTTADLWQTHPRWSGVGLVKVWCGWAYFFLGTIWYEQNDMEAAKHHWQQVEALRYRVNPGTFHNSLVGLALVAQAQGEAIQALAYAQTAREFATELRSLSLLMMSEALEVRLALLNGNLAEALHRSREITTATNQGTSIWLEPPPLTVLRVLLAQDTPTSLTEAQHLAETCLRQASDAHNTRQIIQIMALQALIWQALKNSSQALKTLDRALYLAEPSSFVRTFIDLGPPMAELLRNFDSQREPTPYVKQLLAAFVQEVSPANPRDLTPQYVQLYGVTPLTPRELELLALVGQRLTVKEIAERLIISPNTVKKHVSNIYAKLGVNNRRQAIAKAKEVGLLPPA